jgi:type II secretory pathway pseudopilin PulG
MDAPSSRVHVLRMRSRTAHTLLELAIVLTLIGAAAAAAAGPLHGARDQVAVAAARRELAAMVAATRSVAIMAGGARLLIDLPAATVWIETASGVHPGWLRDFGDRYGVTMAASRTQRLELRFDGLGVGRMTSATMQVRRGRAVSELVVSSYGRVRQ